MILLTGAHQATHSQDSLCKNTAVGSCSLLQGIFPTQGLNPGLLHYRQILYCLSHQGMRSLARNMNKRKNENLGHFNQSTTASSRSSSNFSSCSCHCSNSLPISPPLQALSLKFFSYVGDENLQLNILCML